MPKNLGPVGHLVKDKDAKERATLKGLEIAKLGPKPRQNVKFSGADVDIEIVSLNPIEGGIEVFARAWENGEQIGFGQDGSVDIERFRIFNPPILVSDGTQTLTEVNGEPKLLDNLKEDLEAAVLQSLAHTIKVKKEKRGAERIVAGKVGNTTSTFYPDADPESTSVDGGVSETKTLGSGVDWSVLRGAAGSTPNDDSIALTDGSLGSVTIRSDNVTDKWRIIGRSIILFDTSSIPDSDAISAATLSVKGYGKADNLSVTPDINVYSSAPASNTAVAAGDFDSLGTTAYATAITYASFSTSAYNDFALNASGLASISKTGVSKFGLRNANYDVADVAPTWSNSAFSRFEIYSAEQGGTDRPKLVVEHAAAASGPAGVKTFNGTAVASVKTLNGTTWASVKTLNGTA